MANGDVHDDLSDQYLQQFDRSVGVSGMQKLQEFPSLQKLGYNGQLNHLKQGFHGLTDFKTQMAKYSSVSKKLLIAWALISAVVPNNPSILKLLFSAPGLGTVGDAFKSIHNFGQVFALSPSDLKSPATVQSKVSVYQNQSTQADVVTQDANSTVIGGGAGLVVNNANQLNGIQIIGFPSLTNNSLSYNGTNLTWGPAGGGGGGSSTLAGLLDVTISAPTAGQVLTYNGTKWVNQAASGGSPLQVNSSTISNPNFLDGSDVIFHVSGPNITLEVFGGTF